MPASVFIPALIRCDRLSWCNVTCCVAHVLSKRHTSHTQMEAQTKRAPPEALAGQAAADKCNKYGGGTACIWAQGQDGLNKNDQISRCEFFFFHTTYCWQRACWQSWHIHSVRYVPNVGFGAHVPILCRNIYSLSCSSVYVCVWVRNSVDLRALQGCEARSSKRQKIPAAFGLMSANRKPGIMV